MPEQFAQGFTTLKEEIACDSLPVQGSIPTWLEGSLFRTGPAQFEVGQQRYRHWFDGLAMLHSFSFQAGAVSYANKFLQSPAYKAAKETGKISFGEFATDPCRSIFQRVASAFSSESGANANVNISKMGEAFVALTEIPLPVEFDSRTLETVGVIHHDDGVAGQHSTAHPHYDPIRRAGINSITQFGPKSHYNIHTIADGTTQRTLIGSIPVREPAYIHSFGMTENYIVLVEFPLVVNPLSLLTHGKPFIENFQWKPELGTHFHVMRAVDGRVVKSYPGPTFFAFHHINAFERGNDVVVDIVTYPNASIIDNLYLDKVTTNHETALWGAFTRYILPLDGDALIEEAITEEGIELPRINYERNNGREYQFVYSCGGDWANPNDFLNRLVKIDVQAKTAQTWQEDGCYPGEPIFVAAPQAHAEDEGVLLSVVLNSAKGNSFLLVLDATTFRELARAEVPHHIPFSFHGMYSSLREFEGKF
ncbi:15,15' beta carotene dioxygenase [Reticulibacter mediterranei]|uniref:15,15' beta carotene dioxygenase n=1 Tax=Reticulibacter mediterranei TaxID=2778369 RepID=A0A8J3ISY3_9CHLR|nr:carotenoid oxygenase family protein [Reticulibacter mediterranei]GHO97970.1 15,15' beta carotene dioxygenase [Reticulibacter mediterranei]